MCEGVDRDMNLVLLETSIGYTPVFLLEKAVDLGTSVVCFYTVFLLALFTSPPTLISTSPVLHSRRWARMPHETQTEEYRIPWFLRNTP